MERRGFLFSGPNPGGSSAALDRAGRPAFRMESPRRQAYGVVPRDKNGTSLTDPGARRTGPEGPVSRFLRSAYVPRASRGFLRRRPAAVRCGRCAAGSPTGQPRHRCLRSRGRTPGRRASARGSPIRLTYGRDQPTRLPSGEPPHRRPPPGPPGAVGTGQVPASGGRTPPQSGGRRRPASSYGQVQREGVRWHVGRVGPACDWRACAGQFRGIF